MFNDIIANTAPYSQGAFNIQPYINRAMTLSNNEMIQYSEDLLQGGANTFNRTGLLNIWRRNEVPFHSKALLTFWWGGISHQFAAPRFYQEENLERLENMNPFDNNWIANIDNQQTLITLYNSFRLNEGVNNLDGISTAFFTKLFQFGYESTFLNLEANASLPIIADQWSMKAVLAEMIDNGDDWAAVFVHPSVSAKNKLIVSFSGGVNVEAIRYAQFINYFNTQVNAIGNIRPFDAEGILFGWAKDIHNPDNPRNIAENIIRSYFGFLLV